MNPPPQYYNARLLWVGLLLPLAGCTHGSTAAPIGAASDGARLFAANCATCHRYGGGDGVGGRAKSVQSASDLKGFASREWLTGLFDPKQADGPKYFGATNLKNGKMVRFVKRDVPTFTEEDMADLRKIITAVSAEAGLPAQREADRRDAAIIAEGKQMVLDKAFDCTECHTFHIAEGDGATPRLTGFGSRDWLVEFISNPNDPRIFGAINDRMPAFRAEKRLSESEIGLIADWLRGEEIAPARP